MPGIVGIIGRRLPEEKDSMVRRMVNSMMHESFYSSGVYVHRPLNVWLGWVSHAASFADCMPVWNETKDVFLVFSGEEFTDAAELARLKARGHAFSSVNASYLVHLYEEQGSRFLEKLNGWFNGVVVDLRKGEFLLFNDRYGLQRLYYYADEKGFYFASEAKALLRVLPELRRLDVASLAEVFSCGCVLGDKTLFPKIALLPAGSKWTFCGTNAIRKDAYFSPASWENQPTLSASGYYRMLKETFRRILPRYVQANAQVGVSLTGGLDGRMIMAWAPAMSGGLPCYTFGGSYRECADIEIARRVARICGQSHETITVDDQFLAAFPRLAERVVYISDGVMDVSGAVELYVNSMARKIAPIRLTGNYGSEIVRGKVAFRPTGFNDQLLAPEFTYQVRMAATHYARQRQGHEVSFIAFKQVPWYHYARLSVELSQLTVRSPYLDNDLVSLMYRAPPELIRSCEPSLRLIAEGNPNLARIPTDRGLMYLPTPFISKCHRLYQEFAAKAEYAYDYGMPPWLARLDHLLSPLHLERMFLGRHKFYHFRIWYRDSLSEYLQDILLDRRARNRPYLNGPFLAKMIDRHVKGTCNYTLEIHRVLTAEVLHRQLIEQDQC